MPARSLDSPHWSFAVAVYREKDVPEACLLLQNKCGVDISLLLFILFCAVKRGFICDPRCIANLDGVVAPWRNEVVSALRVLRQRLKSGPPPAPSRATASLRKTIKSAELRAEKIQMTVLAKRLPARVHAPSRHNPELHSIVDSVIEFFADRSSPKQITRSDVDAARTIVANAAARIGSRRHTIRK